MEARRGGSYEDIGTPRGIRTPDLLLRRQLLYPAELLAHMIPANTQHIKSKPSAAGLIRKGRGRERCELPLTLERVMGIEPTYPAWKAGVLPLNYTRMCPVSESNQGHTDFQSVALPTELTGQVVAGIGFEPMTSGL